jgi:TPR repeat protein
VRRFAGIFTLLAFLSLLFGIGLLAGLWAIDVHKVSYNSHPRDNAATSQAGQSRETSVGVGSSAHSISAHVSATPVADRISDEEAKDLAYRAASDEQQALQTLQNGVAANEPAAEYGLGLYYKTRASVLFPPPASCIPTLAWTAEHGSPADRRKLSDIRKGWQEERPDMLRNEELCSQATSWLERAASARDPVAQSELGEDFYNGTAGVFLLGSSLGEDTQEMRDHMRPACKEALRWLRTAAAAHETSAEETLAMAYATGICVGKSQATADSWWQSAVRDGSAVAGAMLAGEYRNAGEFTKARAYFEKAERDAKGDPNALESLSVYFHDWDADNEKYWADRSDQAEAAQEQKYPVLKLIHEKTKQLLFPEASPEMSPDTGDE